MFTGTAVCAIEALMLEKFRTEPFHNLRLLYASQVLPDVIGGTCSDKTLSFIRAVQAVGGDARLHSAFIGGREIHRLASVRIDGHCFFADVGNGWPALKLYPADREISFRCFGMGFRTEIQGQRLSVFHEKNGRESLQLEIDRLGKPECEIKADIAQRFRSGVVYPFSNSVRFSCVVGDRFLFLRGDQLEIYGDNGVETVVGIEIEQLPVVLRQYFGYPYAAFFQNPQHSC